MEAIILPGKNADVYAVYEMAQTTQLKKYQGCGNIKISRYDISSISCLQCDILKKDK